MKSTGKYRIHFRTSETGDEEPDAPPVLMNAASTPLPERTKPSADLRTTSTKNTTDSTFEDQALEIRRLRELLQEKTDEIKESKRIFEEGRSMILDTLKASDVKEKMSTYKHN